MATLLAAYGRCRLAVTGPPGLAKYPPAPPTPPVWDTGVTIPASALVQAPAPAAAPASVPAPSPGAVTLTTCVAPSIP